VPLDNFSTNSDRFYLGVIDLDFAAFITPNNFSYVAHIVV
jgi:hypothetical protein